MSRHRSSVESLPEIAAITYRCEELLMHPQTRIEQEPTSPTFMATWTGEDKLPDDSMTMPARYWLTKKLSSLGKMSDEPPHYVYQLDTASADNTNLIDDSYLFDTQTMEITTCLPSGEPLPLTASRILAIRERFLQKLNHAPIDDQSAEDSNVAFTNKPVNTFNSVEGPYSAPAMYVSALRKDPNHLSDVHMGSSASEQLEMTAAMLRLIEQDPDAVASMSDTLSAYHRYHEATQQLGEHLFRILGLTSDEMANFVTREFWNKHFPDSDD